MELFDCICRCFCELFGAACCPILCSSCPHDCCETRTNKPDDKSACERCLEYTFCIPCCDKGLDKVCPTCDCCVCECCIPKEPVHQERSIPTVESNITWQPFSNYYERETMDENVSDRRVIINMMYTELPDSTPNESG